MKGLKLALSSAVLAGAVAVASAHEAHKHAGGPAEVPPDLAKVLERYRAAFEARSTDKLAEVVSQDLLVLEGTGKNVGWPDYRDNHIGPEMKEWQSLTYSDAVVLDSEVAGDSAWAVTQATVTIVSGGKTMTIDASETLVLRRREGEWRIRHIHWSGRRRPEPKP